HLPGLVPDGVAAERAKSATHVDLIGFAAHRADRRESLQPVIAAERHGRRVIDDAVARMQAAQRRRLAVAHLHEALGAPAAHVLGRGDGNEVARHDAAGANTRSRWPSGSSATKVRPKSMSVGVCAIASPRRLQSSWVAATAAAFSTVNAISLPPTAS